MTGLLVMSLAGLAVYLGRHWSEARAENAALRLQIASLKR